VEDDKMERNTRTMPSKVEAKTRNWENLKELEIVRCQAKRCKRDNLYIMRADDEVTVKGKSYHKGCEPPD
jgi:hypothetical protein